MAKKKAKRTRHVFKYGGALTEREQLFLAAVSRKDAAAVFSVPPETLDLWHRLGLPGMLIQGELYFAIVQIHAWLRQNRDLVWLKTPEKLLPQKIGEFVVVPNSDKFETLLPQDPDLQRIIVSKLEASGVAI